MTTITFKVDDAEARTIRLAARRTNLSLSEFVRRQVRLGSSPTTPVGRVKCRHTGALVFAPDADSSKLTTQTVREMLKDFP